MKIKFSSILKLYKLLLRIACITCNYLNKNLKNISSYFKFKMMILRKEKKKKKQSLNSIQKRYFVVQPVSMRSILLLECLAITILLKLNSPSYFSTVWASLPLFFPPLISRSISFQFELLFPFFILKVMQFVKNCWTVVIYDNVHRIIGGDK